MLNKLKNCPKALIKFVAKKAYTWIKIITTMSSAKHLHLMKAQKSMASPWIKLPEINKWQVFLLKIKTPLANFPA